MSKVRHVMGISGGKDSAALAIYLFQKYPQLPVDYYTSDTGKELEETYQLIKNLEGYLGKTISVISAADKSPEKPFDHFLKLYGGYLPSTNARWCTKKLKLEPFEQYVGTDPVVSYVGIRGDEDREGYISTKSNIQSIFPFRKNIWSEDVVRKFLANENLDSVMSNLAKVSLGLRQTRFEKLMAKKIEMAYPQTAKLAQLMDAGLAEFNQLVFHFLKSTSYPLAQEEDFPLVDNTDVLVLDDIYKLLKESGVGVPTYYNKVSFEVNGQKGQYARSRSGCYFCFFQQKIEWVWLLEQHPERFKQAMEYEDEKAGFTWNQNESLKELMLPARVESIKEEYVNRKEAKKSSSNLLDILDDEEVEGCAACFI